MDELTPRDEVADRLRRKDAELGGHKLAPLPWRRIAELEQRHWHAMADTAYAAVTAVADVERLATPSGPR